MQSESVNIKTAIEIHLITNYINFKYFKKSYFL